MRKHLGFVAVLVFLFSCANTDRDNPYDERAINYIGNAFVEGSSSSVGTDGEPSSSSEESPSSSGSVGLSSSYSNSSSSSSSLAPSSSSSARLSSSSVVPSSSSNVGCAGFVNGTEREHYDKMKKQFCDERDGKKYVYVKIGEQTWMAENLNYAASGSKCYGDDPANCNIYGRLYNWATAMDLSPSCNYNTCPSQINSPHRGICPAGWHIPSYAEWDALVTYAGGFRTAGIKLKATSGWNSSNGTNDYGFSALPGGAAYSDSFNYVGRRGHWWSTDENEDLSSYTYSRGMDYDSDYANWLYGPKTNLFSVRCLQD